MVTTRTDAELKARVEQMLRDDVRLALDGLRVEVGQGIVHLKGSVPNLLQKREAVAAARRCAGQQVVDELAVGPPQSAPDHDVKYHVEDALVRDRRLSEHLVHKKVSAEVKDGVVLLTGLVDSPAERHFVEEDVWAVPGVAGIDDRIDVGPVPGRPVGEIAADVFETLRANPWIDSSGVSVRAEGQVVYLAGRVPDREQKRSAGDAAWWVPGVRDVRNELTTGGAPGGTR